LVNRAGELSAKDLFAIEEGLREILEMG